MRTVVVVLMMALLLALGVLEVLASRAPTLQYAPVRANDAAMGLAY
ncbi:MAG TPA: hypothetical protein VFQ62_03515 [Methylomirabilota bacterium]|nr:hypothetical protein [Methylomirabilota bacterium]